MIIRRQAFAKIPSLYKYMPVQYAHDLVERGRFRLGTLHDFQDVENHGTALGDKEEGLKLTYANPALVTMADSSPDGRFLRNFVDGTDSRTIIFDRCLFELNDRSPNAWLFCCSKRTSASLMSEFNADTCVEITDGREFFRAIFDRMALGKKARQMDVMNCVYRNRAQHYSTEDGVPPVAIKEPKHRHQSELRAVFTPMRLPIEPIVICAPAVMAHCRILSGVPVV
jgi:hypothetical protein